MKLICMTPNMINVANYISDILNNNYNADGIMIDKLAYKHCFMLLKITKEDICLENNMLKTILSFNKNGITKLIETQYSYYLSIQVSTILDIYYSDYNNIFVNELRQLVDNKLSYLLSGNIDVDQYPCYPIIYRHKFKFNIISDIKYISNMYLHILSDNDDISKMELNELFNITIHLKVPIYIARELYRVFSIISDCNYSSYIIEFERLLHNNSNLTFRLSYLLDKDQTNINPNGVYINTSQDKLIGMVYNIYDSFLDKTIYDRSLPLSTITDVILNLNINELIQFINKNSIYINKPFYKYIKPVVDLLLQTYNMEYILLNKNRL